MKFTLSKILILASVIASLANIYLLYSQSIRLDESQSIWIATKSVRSIFFFISQDVHLPLYTILLHFWMQIFGTSIIAARTLSLIFFVLTLPVLYRLSEEVSNSKVASLHIALFTLSPFILWYSTEARMYTLFAFLTALSNLYFLRMIKTEGRTSKFGYFIATVFGMYSHYFFLLVVATQLLYVFTKAILTREKRLLLLQISLNFGAFLFLLPWVYYFIKEGAGASMQPLISTPTSYNVIQTFTIFFFGFQTNALQAALISLWPISMLLLFFIFTQKKEVEAFGIDYMTMATFLPIVLVFLISFIKPIFLTRYLIFVTPTLFFLIAWILINSPARISKAVSIIPLAIMLFFSVTQNISAQTPVREDYKSTATYLEQQATPQDIIAVSAPFTTYPIEYNYSGHAKIETIPFWDRYKEGPIPAFSPDGLVTQMDNYKQVYQRIFVVLSYDQGYQKDIQNYMDTHFELLDVQEYPPNIEVRVYKLRYD